MSASAPSAHTPTSSSSTLLSQLIASSDTPSAISSLLHQFAPQLLQLEQQIETRTFTHDAQTLEMYEWVREYTRKNETVREDNEEEKQNAHSTSASSPHKQKSHRNSSHSSIDSPAPLFFYFLHRPASYQLCLGFLSALYTDPSTDQDFYWLNDCSAFVEQCRRKVKEVKEQQKSERRRYAQTKRVDTHGLANFVTLYSGLCEVLSTLLSARIRALSTQLTAVQQFLSEVIRAQLAATWERWLAESQVTTTLDEALAGSDSQSWYHAVSSRRTLRASSHALAFRSFLLGVQSSDPELAASLVDNEYSEEPELFVDRLWSLATNQHPEDSTNEATNTEQHLSWTYPPPSVASMLDIFLLTDETSAASKSAGQSPTTPPQYKFWLMYYFLLDFESRSSNAHSSNIAHSFAVQSGLNERQQALIQGMVHMDAAYDPTHNAAGVNSSLSPARHGSFLRALSCFSDYDALLSQSDFPFVSSILASVITLKQWKSGISFFQNCFLANAAAAIMAQKKFNAAAGGVNNNNQDYPTVHMVFYSTSHYVFYVHILLQKSLVFEAMQFIRSQAEIDATSISESPVNTTLQIVLWQYWIYELLRQRRYQIILKQIALSEVEEEIVVRYWKKHRALIPANQVMIANPTLAPADLLILYHFEHHAHAKALHYYRWFVQEESKKRPEARQALRVPQQLIDAYMKLIGEANVPDADAEAENSRQFDLAYIQLRALTHSLAKQQASSASLLQSLLSVSRQSDIANVDMLDLARQGSELNPFAPSNQQQRTHSSSSAVSSSASTIHPTLSSSSSSTKSPEKTPLRVKQVSSTLSAAKAKHQAQVNAKAEQEALKDKLEKEREEREQAMDEDEEDEDNETAFPSFAASQTHNNKPRAVSTPPITRTSTTFMQPSESIPMANINSSTPVRTPSKPIAFSDSGAATGASTSTPGAAKEFVLPVVEPTSSPTPTPPPSASKRVSHITRAESAAKPSRAPSVIEAVPSPAPAATTSLFASLPSPMLPDSSQFTPSFLAPSTSATTSRLKSTRKRPHLPSASPVVSSISSPIPATSEPTRATRSSRLALPEPANEDAALTNEKPKRSSRTSSRRTPTTDLDDDTPMDDGTSAAAAAGPATRVHRRTASSASPAPIAPIATPASNPFQRGGSSTSARRSTRTTGPIFIDESLLMSDSSKAHVEEMDEQNDEDQQEEEVVPKRTRSSRVSPAVSESNSPVRVPSQRARKGAAATSIPAASPPLQSTPALTRSARSRSSNTLHPEMPPVAPASTSTRRTTRHTAAAAVAEETPAATPSTRTTRSRSKLG